jgi:hypothetical protein
MSLTTCPKFIVFVVSSSLDFISPWLPDPNIGSYRDRELEKTPMKYHPKRDPEESLQLKTHPKGPEVMYLPPPPKPAT